MEPEINAELPAGEPTAIAPAPAKDGPISLTDAMRSVVDWRRKSAASQTTQDGRRATDASADNASSEQTESTAQADDTAPAVEQAPGETESAEPPDDPSRRAARAPQDDEAPIEPPRSWTKDEKERFRSLPRETQEYLANREQTRDRELRRSENEAAEQRKALDAEHGKVEQARAQYESALPQLLETLQQQASEFGDIKTLADVEKLAREDWPRYLQWDLAQKRVAAVQQQMLAARERQAQEQQAKFAEFARREDSLFAEKVTDMADADKASRLQKQALNVLTDLGFSEQELARSWNGQGDLSLRDHRVQLLVRDAILWRDAQAKAKAAATKPVPPVVRPGAATARPAAREQELQSLSKRLDQTGSLKDAAALLRARRAGR
jgi:hypothetical protein